MKRIFSFVLVTLLMVLPLTGCQKTNNPSSDLPGYSSDDTPKSSEEFQVAASLKNLVPNGRFKSGTDGWTLSKGAAYANSFSRSTTDNGSIVIKGDGSASFKIENVESGRYQLRFFVYDKRSPESADMTLFVNKSPVQKLSIVSKGWWLEYVSNPVTLDKSGEISFRLTVAGSNAEIYLDEVQLLKIPYDMPEPVTGKNPVSCLRKRSDGTYYIEYNGRPAIFNFTYTYAENDKYTLDQMVAKAKEAGYTGFIPAITWGIAWNEVQPSLGSTMDFSKIDKILEIAEKYDMYVDLQWYGLGYGPGTGRAPAFVQNVHKNHSHKPDGSCDTYELGGVFCIAKFNVESVLNQEKEIIRKLMEYIHKKDVNRRIVGIELECEATEAIYNSHEVTVESIAAHINELAKVVKESEHPMITHVNHGYGMASHFVFNTPYIDMNGPDPYGTDVGVTKQLVSHSFDSRVPHIMENSGCDNITSHIVTTLARGGFLAIYPIAENSWNQTNGVYGENFAKMPWTDRLTAFNEGLKQCETFLAKAPLNSIAAFNSETNMPSIRYSATKPLGAMYVRMEVQNNDAVGLAVADGKSVYCLADKNAYFSVFGTEASAEYGAFNKDGKWVSGDKVNLQDCKDGSYRATYQAGKVLKLTVSSILSPDPNKKPESPIVEIGDPIDAPVGKNLIGNYSFETGIEDGWVWQTTCQVLHSTAASGIVDGKYCINFWNNTPALGHTTTFGYYDIGVVPPGQYTYSFHIFGGCYGEGEFRMQIYVNDNLEVDTPIMPGAPTNVKTDVNIKKNSKVRVAISIDNKTDLGGAWSLVDMVEFKRVK